jgi:hypothetical protein
LVHLAGGVRAAEAVVLFPASRPHLQVEALSGFGELGKQFLWAAGAAEGGVEGGAGDLFEERLPFVPCASVLAYASTCTNRATVSASALRPSGSWTGPVARRRWARASGSTAMTPSTWVPVSRSYWAAQMRPA